MRSPNAGAIKAQCQAALGALMKRHGLGEPVEVVVDQEGWVNPCFFVNGTHVFRFNARDAHLPKFQREKVAFERLAIAGVPAPRDHLLDDSRELVPFDVLIAEKIDGSNLEAQWKFLGAEERATLARAAGKVFTRVHEIVFPFFGELSSRGPLPRTASWWEYLKAKFELHLSEAAELFSEPDIVRMCEAFSNAKAALKEVTEARLVHGDAHLGNLLFKGSDVTAVLDFEWSCAGDPLYDFCHWTMTGELWPGSRDAFLEGAGRVSFTPTERQRLNFYQMLGNLEICSVAAKHFPPGEVARYVTEVRKYLEKLGSRVL